MITAKSEVQIRQHLTLVALGKAPADRVLHVGKLLDTATRSWTEKQEIVIKGDRIAYVGPIGSWPGTCETIVKRPDLMAIPGLGEVHKHIESSHLTPEWEAALVLPRGNTWTCEASHEFSNVRGSRTVEFWLEARKHGSPLKIFPLPGSAVPPTAYEHGGGYLGYDEQKEFISNSMMVAGLDEVMDWPAVWNPENASHKRLWGMIEATFEARGVVEGHAAGLKDLPTINAFAAAGLASDHEAWTAEEFWDKLTHGLFIELRPHSMPEVLKGLMDKGLQDWSQIAFTTDDRSASETLQKGATDYNVRLAIQSGLTPEIAIQCVTINPARHMRLTPWVGVIAPGRFADIVLLSDLEEFEISEVWADGRQVSNGERFIDPVPQIAWPEWARNTVQVGGALNASDFAIPAEKGRQTMTAAVLRPFHWEDDFLTYELKVENGQVLRDTSRNVTKFAIVDRFSGAKSISKMFWAGTGPSTPDCALASSLAHDKHNIWCVGSSDEAMALAVNTLSEIGGGWALVHDNNVVATVRYEIAGLMSSRSAEDLDKDMQALYAQGEKIDWMFEPSSSPRWWAGFPERLAFATLTCAPWRWVLVAPTVGIPEGLVNVATGETHPVVW
ncbi:adenine deaminase C-terminal domain-containing protein [uncultured Cohaesibacter sp.]|uniref:adenine deaminase n=1 Tax=uncultured Cohaesibacter sp. TaxID=1002546 RepID=UPI0029C976B4|nr:adenine deaminase C-terminal domain-containing protein [uncultured Cohaesibacter sp.]